MARYIRRANAPYQDIRINKFIDDRKLAELTPEERRFYVVDTNSRQGSYLFFRKPTALGGVSATYLSQTDYNNLSASDKINYVIKDEFTEAEWMAAYA